MNRRTILVAGLGGLAIVVLWFLFLWGPRSSDLDAARERTQQAQDDNQRLELRLARLEGLRDNEPQLRSQLEQLRAAIPDQPLLAEFILDVNDAAARSGIDFISIAPTPPVPGPDPTDPPQINLNLSISGGYFQVLDFLNRVEDLDRLVVVDTVDINAQPDESSSTSIMLGVSLTARMFTTEIPPTPGGPGSVTGATGDEATTTSTTAAGGLASKITLPTTTTTPTTTEAP